MTVAIIGTMSIKSTSIKNDEIDVDNKKKKHLRILFFDS